MKLLLTSSGLSNSTIIASLARLYGSDFSQSTIVYIDTAAVPVIGHEIWSNEDKNKFINLKPKSFESIDISKLTLEQIANQLNGADIITVGGGNTAFLASWLDKLKLKSLFHQLLQTKIYIGISAGSQVTANKLWLKDWGQLYNEEVQVETDSGLGLVDFDVIPHLNSNWFTNLREEKVRQLTSRTKTKAYALDDDSAILIDNHQFSVVSEGDWLELN